MHVAVTESLRRQAYDANDQFIKLRYFAVANENLVGSNWPGRDMNSFIWILTGFVT